MTTVEQDELAYLRKRVDELEALYAKSGAQGEMALEFQRLLVEERRQAGYAVDAERAVSDKHDRERLAMAKERDECLRLVAVRNKIITSHLEILGTLKSSRTVLAHDPNLCNRVEAQIIQTLEDLK